MARQRGALISILWIINYIFAVAYVHCSGLSKLSAERLKAKQLPPCRFLLAASIDGSLSNDVPVAFSSKSQHRTDRFVNMYSDFSHWYRFYLERYPYRTNSITGALLAIFGDISAQVYTSFTHFDSSIQSETRFTRFLNLRRTASMAIVSGLFGSPITTWWFQFINLLPQFQGIGKLKKAIAMTLLDQSVGVVFITAGFFFFNAMIYQVLTSWSDGQPIKGLIPLLQTGREAVKSKLYDTLIVNWSIWPIINFMNFCFVSPHFRVLTANAAALFWNMYLSQVANAK